MIETRNWSFDIKLGKKLKWVLCFMCGNHEMTISWETRWKINQGFVLRAASNNDKAKIQLSTNQNFRTRTFADIFFNWFMIFDLSVKNGCDTFTFDDVYLLKWDCAWWNFNISHNRWRYQKINRSKSAAHFQLNQSHVQIFLIITIVIVASLYFHNC